MRRLWVGRWVSGHACNALTHSVHTHIHPQGSTNGAGDVLDDNVTSYDLLFGSASRSLQEWVDKHNKLFAVRVWHVLCVCVCACGVCVCMWECVCVCGDFDSVHICKCLPRTPPSPPIPIHHSHTPIHTVWHLWSRLAHLYHCCHLSLKQSIHSLVCWGVLYVTVVCVCSVCL